MNLKIMTLTIALLLSILTAFTSCNGQNTPRIEKTVINETIATGDTVQKPGDSLWYIYQDKKNNYWFGSNGEGVYRYDGKIILNFTVKNGLCSDSIRQIQEDKSGNIYFSTMSGINKFDGKTITTLEPIESKEWKLEANDLWFHMLGKKDEHGPYRYDGKNLYHLEFPKHFLHDEIYGMGINPFFSPYEIYSIYKDRKGFLWFGTSVFGACRFDGKSIKWMYERDLTIVPDGGSFGIRAVFEDREGSFWICNTRHRFVFNIEETAKSDRLKYQKLNGIGNAAIFDGDEYIYYSAIVEDRSGDIWLTTWDKGVYKYDGENITHYSVKEGSEDINLVSMYKDNRGDLWLGTPENGVYKFNGNKFEKFKP
ncbi:MAG: two-component regulator propeller domain-containing protein [Bacteroidota bacterium]